ncbi:HNH endonuclease signature motif containing protein [Microbacterium sp. 10M-3C3]|uniref:HNH endonuclease signature motif containing protein n=1 Tax=Microbacterium sp. 10M-3C3 TaxID=2483401 RepID=UPI000F642E93|nr:HNH endonuclease signature motif containing protein [Microbacterium sp. 10M-3C3]
MIDTASIAHPDEDDAALAGIVDRLVAADEAIAEIEAAKICDLAAALRIANKRAAHQSAERRMRELEERSIATEIGLATRVNDRAVQNRMHAALELVDGYPATLDALAESRISARHAMVIVETGRALTDPDTRALYETVVLERALRDTAPRTRAFAEQVAQELHPRSITERHREAVKGRTVWMQRRGEGMSELGMIAPTVLAEGIWDRLTQQAHETKTAQVAAPEGDTEDDDAVYDQRNLDQIRADIAIDLLLTGGPSIDPTTGAISGPHGGLAAIQARASIVIPALTAAGLADRGAALDGATPVDADTARCLLAQAPSWERILTHPIHGHVLATDTYRRPANLDRYLAARDIHCRFPGCRRPARHCDRDHNRDWALGGTTDACNLACLCKRHHTLKTEKPWKPVQLRDGSIRWTSPLGKVSTDPPERYVIFRDEPDPPPGDPPF